MSSTLFSWIIIEIELRKFNEFYGFVVILCDRDFIRVNNLVLVRQLKRKNEWPMSNFINLILLLNNEWFNIPYKKKKKKNFCFSTAQLRVIPNLWRVIQNVPNNGNSFLRMFHKWNTNKKNKNKKFDLRIEISKLFRRSTSIKV